MNWDKISILVQVFCTLAIFSFLYKDNPIYKFVEHLFVGVATGWWIILEYRDVIWPNLVEPMAAGYAGTSTLGTYEVIGLSLPRWAFLHLALVLGLMLFFRYIPKVSYLARWSMAVIVGTFSGLAIRGFGAGDVFNQIRANIIPFFADGTIAALSSDFGMRTILEVLRNPVMIIGTLTVLVYFFFSTDHKGAVGGVASVGIWFLMVSFGASYGNTVMARISLFIGRSQFLLIEQTGGMRHWPITIAFALLIIAALAAWETTQRGGDDGTDAPR